MVLSYPPLRPSELIEHLGRHLMKNIIIMQQFVLKQIDFEVPSENGIHFA